MKVKIVHNYTCASIQPILAKKGGCDQRGIFTMTAALALVALMGMVALGVEVGRWYIVRAELSKSVDAASLQGANNLSNPYLDSYFGVGTGEGIGELVKVVGQANFTPGLFGAAGGATFSLSGPVVDGKVAVEAQADVVNHVSRSMETPGSSGQFDTTHVASLGGAQKRDVEVMLVLDKSGSMSYGGAIGNLQVAATSFLNFFQDTEANDRMGLISFASGVEVNYPMGNYFVSPMTSAINAMYASGGTNTEDAVDQADGPDGFMDQTGIPGDQRVQQFMIFFSDGNPTAFRGNFTRNGTVYDAVGYAGAWDIQLMSPTTQFAYLGVHQYQTGDGLPAGSTACQTGGENPQGYDNTKWDILADPQYGTTAYSSVLGTTNPQSCSINWNNMANYVAAITQQMAIDHAQELKDKGVKIYTVGLGSVNQNFLGQISSGTSFQYYTPDPNQLQELFQNIAKNIKLRLVQI